jgi:hypothetical protein
LLAYAGAGWPHGEEGPSNRLILPLVVQGPQRESLVSILNATATPLTVRIDYVGAVGTPFDAQRQGPVPCEPVELPGSASSTLALSALCPQIATLDGENLGYLELAAIGDGWPLIAASQVTEAGNGTAFRVDAEPLGAFDRSDRTDPSTQMSPYVLDKPLAVRGLVDDASGSAADPLRVLCFVATHEEPKQITIQVGARNAFGALVPAGTAITVALKAREMRAIDVLADAGLRPAGVSGPFRVDFTALAGSPGLLIAGCGGQRGTQGSMDYRLARTDDPADESRRRWVYAGAPNDLPVPNTTAYTVIGPYQIGAALGPAAVNTGAALPTKMVLLTYLRAEDRVRCTIDPDTRHNPSAAWQDLRVVDPQGRVVAGGTGIKDTGIFETGRLADGAEGAWRIEVGGDMTAVPLHGPFRHWGPYGVICESASGMSYPWPVGFGSAGSLGGAFDDF